MRDLTPRQKMVAELVAGGLTSKQIAAELGLRPRYVEHCIQRGADRLGGTSSPRHRMTLWFVQLREGKEDQAA